MQDDLCFWIGLNTPSSKNNRINVGETSIASKSVQFWQKFTKAQFEMQKQDFLEAIKDLPKPLYIEFTFVRRQKRKFDYINMAQVVQDSMKYYEWIIDDNCDELKPYFGDYIHDKEHHGCLIKVLKTKPII